MTKPPNDTAERLTVARLLNLKQSATTEFEMYRNTKRKRKLRAETTLALIAMHAGLVELVSDLDEWSSSSFVQVSHLLPRLLLPRLRKLLEGP